MSILTKRTIVISSVLGAKGQLKPYTKTKKVKVLPVVEGLEWIFDRPKIGPVPMLDGKEFVFGKFGKPYSSKMLRRIGNRANKRSGVKKINLYNGTRHSFGCQRLNEGFSLDEIKQVMGHTDSKTTLRYAQYKRGT